MKRFLTRRNGFIAIAVVALLSAAAIYFLNRPPAKEEVRIGFTWISPGVDQNGDPFGVILEETSNLRVLYTTSMTVVQNKSQPESDPYQFLGGRWYFRTVPSQLVTVAVVEGNTLMRRYDNIMIVTNDPEHCPKDMAPCPAGTVYLLDINLNAFYVLTTARQFVVVN